MSENVSEPGLRVDVIELGGHVSMGTEVSANVGIQFSLVGG